MRHASTCVRSWLSCLRCLPTRVPRQLALRGVATSAIKDKSELVTLAVEQHAAAVAAGRAVDSPFGYEEESGEGEGDEEDDAEVVLDASKPPPQPPGRKQQQQPPPPPPHDPIVLNGGNAAAQQQGRKQKPSVEKLKPKQKYRTGACLVAAARLYYPVG